MWQEELRKHTRYNFTMNLLDGSIFGLGFGFASTVTVLPLFIHSLTDSQLLIGLIASLHTIGWQLPQLLTANHVSRLTRYKPAVLRYTLHERWPFFGLLVVALLLPSIGSAAALPLAFILVTWQALGGGITATAWQSMISKIIPRGRVGTFFGLQSSGFNLLGAGSAAVAGMILATVPSPYNFALCFLLCGVFMVISFFFLAATREPEHPAPTEEQARELGWAHMLRILRRDANFRWFLVARMLSQVLWMSISFFTVYTVRRFQVTEETAGLLTSLLMVSQAVANPFLGWMGDRWGHRPIYALGVTTMTLSAGLALFAPDVSWMVAAFALAGLSNASVWSVAMSFTLEFGVGAEKPLYIGLANTLIAPVTLLAPVVGGGLADTLGFGSTFTLCVVTGVLTVLLLQFVVRNPQGQTPSGDSFAPPVVSRSVGD